MKTTDPSTTADTEVRSSAVIHLTDDGAGALIQKVAEQERQIQNLELALVNARTIGIALGILMKTKRVTRDDAFRELAQMSQRLNRKLIRIAEDVAETGEMSA